jgi:hypothetical protein
LNGSRLRDKLSPSQKQEGKKRKATSTPKLRKLKTESGKKEKMKARTKPLVPVKGEGNKTCDHRYYNSFEGESTALVISHRFPSDFIFSIRMFICLNSLSKALSFLSLQIEHA